jgi:hypothetical protein
LDKCRTTRQPGAGVQVFSKKNIWIHQKNLAESLLIPWYKRAGRDENFCETSIVSALACIFLPPRFFRRLSARATATTSRVAERRSASV